jgi:SAM-dependent methyltransferase
VAYDERGLRFGEVAEQYDQHRPPPPPEAAGLFGDLHGLEVLEVGAGTGLWSRFLIELGATLTIVEPDDAMRSVLERRSPQIQSLAGAAESLPVPDASVDVVVVTSAWHWFEQPAATREMARVLRDDGRLFVLWNGFSRKVPWMNRLTELRENPNDVNARPRGWSATFPDDGTFIDALNVEIDWTWPRTPEQVFAVFGTYSGTLVKSEADRQAMEVELRRRIDELAHDGMLALPMTLRGTIAKRSAR